MKNVSGSSSGGWSVPWYIPLETSGEDTMVSLISTVALFCACTVTAAPTFTIFELEYIFDSFSIHIRAVECAAVRLRTSSPIFAALSKHRMGLCLTLLSVECSGYRSNGIQGVQCADAAQRVPWVFPLSRS